MTVDEAELKGYKDGYERALHEAIDARTEAKIAKIKAKAWKESCIWYVIIAVALVGLLKFENYKMESIIEQQRGMIDRAWEVNSIRDALMIKYVRDTKSKKRLTPHRPSASVRHKQGT